MSFLLRNLPVQACDSRAQGFSTPLARRRSRCPPPSPNLVPTHPIERCQAVRDSTPCLSCRHPPEGHQIGARKRRAPGNTTVSKPYRSRVSTDRLNREGRQLAASVEGEPGPTPAGKTLAHSYPETGFRRERVRDSTTSFYYYCIMITSNVLVQFPLLTLIELHLCCLPLTYINNKEPHLYSNINLILL